MTSITVDVPDELAQKLQPFDAVTVVELLTTLIQLYRPDIQLPSARKQWHETLTTLSNWIETELNTIEPVVDQDWLELVENIDHYAVDMGPEDLSLNHEYYLYGGPKRG